MSKLYQPSSAVNCLQVTDQGPRGPWGALRAPRPSPIASPQEPFWSHCWLLSNGSGILINNLRDRFHFRFTVVFFIIFFFLHTQREIQWADQIRLLLRFCNYFDDDDDDDRDN